MEEPMGERLRGMLMALASIFFVAGFARGVAAAPIELGNDVDISWSRVGGDACQLQGLCRTAVDVLGVPRQVLDAGSVGDQVFFDVDVVNPQLFGGLSLRVHIGDASTLEEVMVLEFTRLGEFEWDALFNDAVGFGHVRLTLSEFDGFEALVLNPTYDIVFSMSGVFEGSTAAVGASFPTYGATISVSGAGTPVPEPATAALLITAIGVGLSASSRRFGRRTKTHITGFS
jgi:hypothetical protein